MFLSLLLLLFNIKIQIIEAAFISRLECCPSNPEIVLSTGDRGGVYLFDFQKQPISPVDSAMHPEAIYAGQFARCQTAGWSWLTNEISAGGDDGVICVWDSADPSQCTMKYSLHQNAVIVCFY